MEIFSKENLVFLFLLNLDIIDIREYWTEHNSITCSCQNSENLQSPVTQSIELLLQAFSFCNLKMIAFIAEKVSSPLSRGKSCHRDISSASLVVDWSKFFMIENFRLMQVE